MGYYLKRVFMLFMQTSLCNIQQFLGFENDNLQLKKGIFFLVFAQNIDLGYTFNLDISASVRRF